MSMTRMIAKTAIAILLAVGAGSAGAQEFPARPVTMVVPFSPGGQADVMARLVAPVMSEKLGQPVVVENRPGAGGVIGAESVFRSEPDGYTFMFCSDALMVVAPLLNSQATFVPEEMTPLTVFSESVMTMYVKADSPIQSVADMIEMSKADPDKITFGSSGAALQMIGELVNQRGGAKMLHVPYPGAGNVLTDVAGGHINIGISALPGVMPFVESGDVRIVAIASSERLPALPEVETVAETVDGVISEPWTGFFAPGGIPPVAVDKLNEALVAAFADERVSKRLEDMNEKIIGSSSDDARSRLAESKAHWESYLQDVDMPRI